MLRWKPEATLLGGRGVRKHVARDLLDREPVEGHVRVEGVDHPVAVGPDRAAVVLLVAVGVGVAREVEPVARPALAVVRRGEQAIDEPFVGVGTFVGQKRVDLRGRRRQAGQVERDAAEPACVSRRGRTV